MAKFRTLFLEEVDDDIALPHLPQARGVAGTLFVHKIAGAMAEVGADLDAVTEAAQKVIAGAVSIGMSLDTCTVPGSPKEDRVGDGKAELGLGIHGEAGIQQVDYTDARAAMAMVAEKLLPHLHGNRHVALLNNLGSTIFTGTDGQEGYAQPSLGSLVLTDGLS